MNAPLPERFELIRPLGSSPHAETRLVRDRATGRTGVLKSLDAARASDEKTLELFRREARVLASLTHPNIPRLLDMIEERTESSLVLHLLQEHAPGENLEEVVRRRGPLPEEEVIDVANGLLDALEALHSVSPPIIHRDLKPSNVVLSDDGTVHLIDFSGARDRMMQDREPGGGGFTIVGTWGYMPYEQYEGRALPASDLYSLGMTLVFLATGKEPLDLERDGMRLLVPDDAPVSMPLRAALEWMIEPDWTRRPPSARDVRQALDRIRPESRARRQTRGALVAAAVTALLWIGLTVARAPSPRRVAIPPPAEAPRSETARRADLPPRNAREVPSVPRLQGAPIPDGPPSAIGSISWGGRPFSERASVVPSLRASTAEAAASFRVDGDTIEAWGLVPGKETIWAIADDGVHTYQGAAEMFLREGNQTRFEISLVQDIAIMAPPPSSGCREDEPRSRGPVTFEWDPVAPGARYDYDVVSQTCAPPHTSRPITSGTVDTPHVTLSLPANTPGTYYSFMLSARLRATPVGKGWVNLAVEPDPSTRSLR